MKNLKYHIFQKNHQLFKEKESSEILKILGLIENMYYFKNMSEESISQEFRLKNIDKTKNYLIGELNQDELISKKQKKVCTTLNYIEHFLIVAITVTGCVSISAFSFLVVIPIRITSFAIGLEICAITAGS